jgi:aminoglycoside 6'-N-acetyltransferase I
VTQSAPIIRSIQQSDASLWEKMRCDLWPGADADHASEIAAFFAGTAVEPQAVFVARQGPGLAGFLELSIREDVVGLRGKRVGYVEGLYVAVPSRGLGVARKLLQAARSWARDNGCEAFASDRAERVIVDPRF